jgi:hypothetical protein
VGSPRYRLQSSSITASASCIAVCFTPAAVVSTVRSPAANAPARERFRITDTFTKYARRAAHALLRVTTGRHAHDEHGARPLHAPAPWGDIDVAVKNLRFVALAVLLLNFREVRRFHFCSTSVAV